MNFDPIARLYPLMELVLAGGWLRRARHAHAAEGLAGRRRILILGDGHGPGAEMALRHAPEAEITVIEASPRMIQVAQARLRRAGLPLERVSWLATDLRAWSAPAGEFDCVIAQFFFDCFLPADLAEVIAQITRAATSDAHLLLCDFRLPTRGWQRARARVIHAMMYAFFRQATRLEARQLTPPDPLLKAAGFTLQSRKTFCAELIHSDLWVPSA